MHEAENCADGLRRELQGSQERCRELTQASGEQAAELDGLREELRHEQRWGRCHLAYLATGPALWVLGPLVVLYSSRRWHGAASG